MITRSSVRGELLRSSCCLRNPRSLALTLNLSRHLGEDPAAQAGSDALLTGVLGQEIPMDPAWWWRQRPAAYRPMIARCVSEGRHLSGVDEMLSGDQYVVATTVHTESSAE